MKIELLVKGILLGFSVAAPVGPIGLLCIRRTLSFGPRYGLLTGLGAATADTIYSLVAGLGLVGVSASLIAHQEFLQLIGGIFLFYLGWKTATAQPVRAGAENAEASFAGAYFSSLALTVTNPLTILSFAAAFAGLGLVSSAETSLSDGLFLVGGVFVGSAAWWLMLSFGTGKLRRRINDRHLQLINRLSGGLIIAFALLAFWQTIIN